MKSFAAVAACLALAVVNAADCDVSALQSLISNPNTSTCGSESGVSLPTLTGAPTEEQMSKLCASDACVSLMETVLATDPADCTLPLGAGLQLRSQLIDPVIAYCTANGVAISAGSSATDATAGSSSSDSSNSTGGVDVGSDDNSTSTTPEPTTGGAAAVTTALGATIALALSVTGALL